MQRHHLKKEAVNAVILAVMCFISYLSVYFLRNILSAVSPQMESSGDFTATQTGMLGGVFFAAYAIGQLINGIIGDRIKAKYMMSIGLTLSGICHMLFVPLADSVILTTISYALVGFFLSMIYAPMTKVVSENVNLNYAQRCSIAYSFSAGLGSPVAGVCAAMMGWAAVFYLGGGLLVGIGIAVFVAREFGVPMVFAKKSKSKNISNDVYSVEVESFTHGNTNTVVASKEYLGENDRVLIIDDFLATGAALVGLKALVEQAGGKVIGAGIAIEKVFQGGGNMLREKGVKKIEDSPIEMLISTDSVMNPYVMNSPKMVTVSVAPLFAEAIYRIHERVSVSSLFKEVPDKVIPRKVNDFSID